MNIIVPDIDQIIVSMTELPALVNLGCVNKYFYKLVLGQPIIKQWLTIKNMHEKKKSIYETFIEVCGKGFLSYAMFFAKENKININADNEYPFRWICANGHIEMANWLIQLGESEEYKRINIHTNDECAFRWNCVNGHIEMARWLIQLGESGEYNRINIHAVDEYAYQI